jgi:hypothetical protein
MITDEAQRWLGENGFRHYCFVSYPYTGEPELEDCAAQVKTYIERELKFHGVDSGVYVAKTDIPPGAEWPDDLRENLCGSIAMVAILMRAYVRHEWCGIEWAAMEALGKARLPNTPIKTIIPLRFRQTELPPSASVLQEIDISQQLMQGKRYYSTNHFRKQASRIVEQILEIANLIHRNRCRAEVKDFVLPKLSAFANVQVLDQPPPGRSQ